MSKKNNSLATTNSNKINIFEAVKLKMVGMMYGDKLYKHFGIMNDLRSYKIMVDTFGLGTLMKALKNKDSNTSEVGKVLYSSKDRNSIDVSNDYLKKYILNNVNNAIDFYNATNIELSDVGQGIKPQHFKRKSFPYNNMIDLLRVNEVNKDTLKEIYDVYGKEIISEYNKDSFLRNQSVLKIDEKHKNVLAVGGLQDHVTDYTQEDFDNIFTKYFEGGTLSETEKYIVIGLIAKESDLIGEYTVKGLRENEEYIKSEINLGIFNDIVVNGKEYSTDERKMYTKLHGIWSEADYQKYKNSEKLKERLQTLPNKEEQRDNIDKVNSILSMNMNDVIENGEEIASELEDLFLDYEVENRINIIENVYDPEKKEEIIISDLSQLGTGVLLHFFNPDRNIMNFDKYIQKLEEKRSSELGREVHLTEDEKQSLLNSYNAKENHYITDKTLEFEGIGQVGAFDSRYVSDVSNQISTRILSPKNILQGRGVLGNIALGFSKSTLTPELINAISDKNLHSNKGIDYVESNNTFNDFSASYDELISEENMGEGTEIVMFRNSYESSLKPSYVMYINEDSLDSETEKSNIQNVKEMMKEAGLKVPLVIFDEYTVKLKEKQKEEKNKNADLDNER